MDTKSKMKPPLVSVVVPSFNSGHFLNWTLGSIKDQTLQNFECIVVDDCSTDDSIKSASEFFKDSRFRLVRHKVNVGLSGARNTGLRAARAPYVAFLDSDDLMMKNSLEVRLNTCRWAARNSDRFAGSYCGSMQIDEHLTTAPTSSGTNLEFIDLLSANGHCPFNANQPMLRRDLLRRSGGFNQSLEQAEDFDLWLRLLRAGYVFAPAKFTSVTYRKRAGSMIRQKPLVHLSTSLSLINSNDEALSEDQLDWSPYRMTKPIGIYMSQARKIDRVFEFLGMELAIQPPEGLARLADLVWTEIPDFKLLVNPAKPIESLIHKGIRRQLGNLDENNRQKTDCLLDMLNGTPPESSDIAARGEENPSVYHDINQDRPWFSENQRTFLLVFIPHSAYHVWTISLLAAALQERGIPFITVDISSEWRDGGVRAAAKEHGVQLIGLSEFILGQFYPHAVVVFNDWDPVTRPLVIAAKSADIPSIAIVEGIQDYDDVDVHWSRYAYKTSDVVLLPGEYDKKYFRGHGSIVSIAGIPRLEALRKQVKRTWTLKEIPRVLINSNFSYGVLEEHRDSWVADCVEVVRELGMTPVISRHPADKGNQYPDLISKSSFYEELEKCDLTIQRFASGILEALAREVGTIYYNPHGEKVDKFKDPMGAYALAASKDALKEWVANWWQLHVMAKSKGPAFLDLHAGDLREGSIERCADALKFHLRPPHNYDQLERFRQTLELLDIETRAFTTLRVNGAALFERPDQWQDDLETIRSVHGHLLSSRPEAKSVPEGLRKPEAALRSTGVFEKRMAEHRSSPIPSLEMGASTTITSARSKLLDVTARLLVEPSAALSDILGSDWAIRLISILEALPKNEPSVDHFSRVIHSFFESRGETMPLDLDHFLTDREIQT